MILKYPSFIYPHYQIYERLGDMDFEKLTAIDIGCGDYRSDVAKQVLEIPFKEITCVEGYKKDFDTMVEKTFQAKKVTPILGFVPDVLPTLKGKYDIAFAFDVIEHLTKEEGEKALDWLDKHIKGKIMIFVPDEPEGFHRDFNDGNELQKHISYWREEDFTKRGYTVERIKNGHSDVWDGKQFSFDALWAIKSL